MLNDFARQALTTRYIGEVGLDSLKGKPDQVEVFESVCDTIRPQSFVSIHSVRSANKLQEILKKTGRLDDCCLIFHWFSEDSDTLKTLRDAGCYFSINSRMLKTKRGREYVRQIDMNNILIETDEPENNGSVVSPDHILRSLNDTYEQIKLIKGL